MKPLRLALMLLAALTACMPRHDAPPAAAADPAHSSRNSLDWAGVYEGVLPCADCPGIRTRLTLLNDGRYALSTQYLDRQDAPRTVSGQFSWNAAGSTIVLDAAGHGQQFRVGEGRLLQLGLDGSVPSWNDPHRVLTLRPGE
ncbi:MAG: copper resistance protein NlpE N-terminal domain-containing protein [Burkholderiales bacterium]|nr:copper resistance protein NlpE N-terminal domain-containing protein [Burkholderiales bacterium]